MLLWFLLYRNYDFLIFVEYFYYVQHIGYCFVGFEGHIHNT